MTFQDILARYRAVSFSERDKGDRFERLMQAFLQTVPWYAGTFRHVWLWREFPYKQNLGGKDTGIDLVAQTVEGDFWAIQCKCYAETASIDKPAVDSFLATSSKQFVNDQHQTTSFALRLWISTTNKWGSEAENAIRHQEPPVQRISLADLESAPVDWAALEQGISGAAAAPASAGGHNRLSRAFPKILFFELSMNMIEKTVDISIQSVMRWINMFHGKFVDNMNPSLAHRCRLYKAPFEVEQPISINCRIILIALTNVHFCSGTGDMFYPTRRKTSPFRGRI